MKLLITLLGPMALLLSAANINAQPVGSVSITPSPSPSPIPSPSPVVSPSAVSQRSVYFSRLSPLNNSGVWGEAMIVVDDNSVGALVRAIGLQPGMQHSQYVESGKLCPDQNADQNNDGYIDSVEAANITGMPFLTLSFSDGSFPISSEAGKLNFIESVGQHGTQPVSSPTFSPPPVFSPSPVSRSGTTPSLDNLGGLVVMINGVGSNVQLPSSVQGVNPNADLPVACGRLRQNLE